MNANKQLHQTVIENSDLGGLLEEYGAIFSFDHRIESLNEVQYKCPIHGKDNKPSARLYKDTHSCYCWACLKRWDAVSLVQDVEGLGYRAALNFLIKKYSIDISHIEMKPELVLAERKGADRQEKDLIFIRNGLGALKGTLELPKYKALCYAYRMLKRQMNKGLDSTETIRKVKDKLKSHGIEYADIYELD